ncbi:MAG: nicotinamide-nucleotide amidohydrolase family protein [Candidatus Rokubacteria bacterium]|nr:nicotinamide-nucleotide amidohydrolase family protein [Candidatus Rokubacteria bacterium]MBI3827571.1 nicotinamide-nucleotide amidohydrolase family protein [Candidatus Rokubacteria bacterium]
MAVTPAARVVTVGVPPTGALLDPDGAAVAAALEAAGVPVAMRVFVDDDETALEQALASAVALTVVLAGDGGSAGDVVRRVVARLAGTRLVLNDRMLAALEEHYRRGDRPLPRRAERLALLPQGASVWLVDHGEPGWAVDAGGRAFIVLPRGGPLAPALRQQLTDYVADHVPARGTVAVRTLRTAGVSLAALEDRLAAWIGREGGVAVSVVPAAGEVWVRLRARGQTPSAAAEAVERAETEIRGLLGPDCFGRDEETLEQAVARRLLARGLTLSVAESCTGGLLGHRLTSVPGSSRYFERGVLVYSNEAKQEMLGVPEVILRAHGAVSAPCAEAMARGIAERSRTACGLSITGIAGPDGGTPTKPVGTVFIGLATPGHLAARHFLFSGDRAAVKWQSTQMALDMLRRALEEDSTP